MHAILLNNLPKFCNPIQANFMDIGYVIYVPKRFKLLIKILIYFFFADASISGELFHGYPSSLLTFASATCIVFILVGVPGNLITIIALARCKKVSFFL